MPDDFAWRTRMEFGLAFGLSRPNMHVKLPTEKLSEPLRKSAAAMQDGTLTEDERKAAGREFLLLSEEYVDRAKPLLDESKRGTE